MSYLLIRVHSFACDYPGCTAEEEHAEPYKRYAVKLMERSGWQIGPVFHRCPKHRGMAS